MNKNHSLAFCLFAAITLAAGAFLPAWGEPDSDQPPQSQSGPPPSYQTDGRPRLLRISATVDGSGRIIFTRKAVHYVHKYWGIPKDLTFDGARWDDTAETPDVWHQIAAHYDLSKAHIIQRDGRDTIALELTEEGFDLYLCDSPNGRDHYEVIISIPPRS